MGYGSWFNVRLMNCEIFTFTSSLSEGLNGGGPLVGCRLKFSYFVGSRLKFSIFVGSRLNFLIFVGC